MRCSSFQVFYFHVNIFSNPRPIADNIYTNCQRIYKLICIKVVDIIFQKLSIARQITGEKRAPRWNTYVFMY